MVGCGSSGKYMYILVQEVLLWIGVRSLMEGESKKMVVIRNYTILQSIPQHWHLILLALHKV